MDRRYSLELSQGDGSSECLGCVAWAEPGPINCSPAGPTILLMKFAGLLKHGLVNVVSHVG